MSNLVHNEQTKLFATFLNNIAIATVAGGIVLPQFNEGDIASPQKLALYVAGTALGLLLHWFARHALSSLKE